MSRVRAEFTVEPFTEGAPGVHVAAAIEAAQVAGLAPEVGPFATAIEGETSAVVAGVRALLDAAFVSGATRVSVNIERL